MAWFRVSVMSEVGGARSDRGHLRRRSVCSILTTTQNAVAMGVALETADVALVADDLNKLISTPGLAWRTQSIVRQNLGLSAVVISALIQGAVFAPCSLPAVARAHKPSAFLLIGSGRQMLKG